MTEPNPSPTPDPTAAPSEPAPPSAQPVVAAPTAAAPSDVRPVAATPTPTATPAVPAQQSPAAPVPAAIPTAVTPPPEPVPPAPTWPDNWRQLMAGEDAKELKRLERFATPADVYKTNRDIEAQISRGEYKRPLPPNPTPEQIKAWRSDNGIPESVDKYQLKMNDGLVIGEQDKPYVDKFLNNLLAANGTNDQASAALNAYYDIVQEISAQNLVKYEEARDKTTSVFQQEWGVEYNRNLNLIQGLIDTMPDAARNHILQGFGADGIPLMSNPDVVRSLVGWARSLNPAAAITLPGGAPVDMKSMEGRHAELSKMMGEDGSAYWKGSQAEALQKEWRELDTAIREMKKKAA
jgi:hypothetical protein